MTESLIQTPMGYRLPIHTLKRNTYKCRKYTYGRNQAEGVGLLTVTGGQYGLENAIDTVELWPMDLH